MPKCLEIERHGSMYPLDDADRGRYKYGEPPTAWRRVLICKMKKRKMYSSEYVRYDNKELGKDWVFPNGLPT
jgi:hypothetical protein